MLTNHQRDLLALCRIEGLNWHLIAREAKRSGGLEMLLSGKVSEKGRVRSKVVDEAKSALRRNLKRLDELREEAEERARPAFEIGARLVTVCDDDYPINLLRIFNLPPFLFYRGTLQESDAFSVAVVGTRKASEDGLRKARKLARLLTEQEVTVVSGLALGIDTAAHTATLATGGRTVAVIGTGICQNYPPANRELAAKIPETGAVLSQFWPMMQPASYTFPRRNVTMSGFSQGTAVVEASATSGAKMQARFALEHGKKAFLLKSLVDQYEWARKYLKRPGAVLVKEVDDIIAELREPRFVRQSVEERAQLRLELG